VSRHAHGVCEQRIDHASIHSGRQVSIRTWCRLCSPISWHTHRPDL
jgi:hypothetical protein